MKKQEKNVLQCRKCGIKLSILDKNCPNCFKVNPNYKQDLFEDLRLPMERDIFLFGRKFDPFDNVLESFDNDKFKK